MAKDLGVIVGRLREEIEKTEEIRAAVLYGSAVGGEYLPGRSDLNVLLIANEITTPLLDDLQKEMKSWRKMGITAPLLVDRPFLVSSTDSYPLEILGMLAGYQVLKGVDPFDGLMPRKEHVRLQAEREIKGKALLLRRAYLESQGNHGRLLAYLVQVVPAFEAILRGMLFLRDADWRKSGPALHEACRDLVAMDPDLPRELREARLGRERPDRHATIRLYGRTFEVLRWLDRETERAAE
ncbi:MAG: hypothetical protein ACE15D_04905 [Candidatus Eisenbacteria bacterium]|nr:hypothetical protein [Candidatus Eisenbacteria bacterium]